jgi:hypothetical protein
MGARSSIGIFRLREGGRRLGQVVCAIRSVVGVWLRERWGGLRDSVWTGGSVCVFGLGELR